MPRIDDWSRQLQRVADEPLTLCPQFPQITRRFEAWWTGQPMGRPILIAAANKNPDRPIGRRLDLLDQPDRWLDAKTADMMRTHRVGEALPNLRVDFGPAMLGGLLGGHTTFGADTAWTEAFIQDDWANAPNWTLDENHPWWIMLGDLTRRVTTEAAGRFLVCSPNLGGPTDAILNLRGPDHLCMDALDQPQRIASAIDAIHPVWKRALGEMYRITTSHGAGLIHWVELWSNKPYATITCDFNYMLGPETFEQVCLADIDRMARIVGRAVFHLDGPGATRHIDALLSLESLDAIQFTPGEGTPSALAWIDMFKRIIHRGKSVLVFCPIHQVIELSKTLGPDRLALSTHGSVKEVDAVFEHLCRLYPDDSTP